MELDGKNTTSTPLSSNGYMTSEESEEWAAKLSIMRRAF